MFLRNLAALVAFAPWFLACASQPGSSVRFTQGTDESAGGGPAYIVTTPAATYYLEKEGGGLSSMLDPDGVDWLGFHNENGSGWKGEYRGFPNAVHRQDGNFFHAMNAGTDASDFWYASGDSQRRPIEEPLISDLPAPEWMAFGDPDSPRVLYVLHHEDDDFPDDYVSRPSMTVLGFGRREKDKYLDTPQTFSIGFIESTDYALIDRTIRQVPE